MVDVICTPPCSQKVEIVLTQEGMPSIPDIWPPGIPPGPVEGPFLDFTDPDNSQYIGQVV